ncbi:hypothetical protein KSD_83540 [Ktedonobacter sp. SOSP1-85]|nr:hypothetical protein KSD_83540 [Ktedonobacter sp. SOSP1-85]
MHAQASLHVAEGFKQGGGHAEFAAGLFEGRADCAAADRLCAGWGRFSQEPGKQYKQGKQGWE